ncbi:Zn-ribbon domain-containing OB-fold protein [Streptomyces sp. NPDC102340]|uniref:Zn-ribbon domain-containing OB-fold protein n=1 Tax=unclassified Streptomyces TaxID=2593676 RepID=UPI0037F823A2
MDSAGFWEATREGRITLCRCSDCGTWLARPLERCHRCGGPTSFADVTGAGTIYSFIVVRHRSVPAFADLVPYVLALVEFVEGPRLPGILLDERGPGVTIGQRVSAELVQFDGAEEQAVAFRRMRQTESPKPPVTRSVSPVRNDAFGEAR